MKKIPWTFEVTMGRVQPRIGRGQDGDPIYLPLSASACSACREYYDQVDRYLNRTSADLPPLDRLSAELPHGAIQRIELASGQDDLFGPKALVTIVDEDRPRETRSPRIFDPEYVPAIVMMTAPGGSVRFNDSKSNKDKNGDVTRSNDRRFLLTFGRRAEQNIRLMRIIFDAPKGQQVHRIHRELDAGYHYDHRKSVLYLKSDDSVVQSGTPAGYSTKGRAAAIEAAGQHFDRALKNKGLGAVSHIATTRVAFERELRRMFRSADDLHRELVKRRRAEKGLKL
ncbi:hypothetical protein ACVW1A_002979 [Bradyrhizobium sp. LB1.3]